MRSDVGVESTGPTLAQVCAFWEEFGLEGWRGRLEEGGLKVAEFQEACVVSRKSLAEATKEFKRNAEEGVVKCVGELLKQYQQEVDRLTKRAKHSEAAYLEVYQNLYEAPDPSGCLAAGMKSASRISDLEVHIRKQAQELAEYMVEAKDIKNQDLTIRKLEEKVRVLEEELENKGLEVGKVQEEADRGVEEKLVEREAKSQSMLKEYQERLEAMRNLHQVSQDRIFALQTEAEEEKAGYRSELEIAVTEIEHAQERVLALETERTQLMMALDSMKRSMVSGGNASSASPDVAEDSLMGELVRQREVASHLRGELAQIKAELEECREGALSQLDAMKDALRTKESHIEAMEAELHTRPTALQVDELKQQVHMLQSIQYSSTGEDQLNLDASNGSRSHESVEQMLLQKNRRLEHEITMAKLKEAEMQQEVAKLQGSLDESEAEVEKQRKLANQLEEDILHTQKMPLEDRAGLQPVALFGEDEQADGVCTPHGAKNTSSQAIAEVLQHQRDRFRQKAEDLGEEISRCQTEMSQLRSEAVTVKKDNVALVERIRFLQGYRKNNIAQGDIEAGVSAEQKYTKEYEARMNPFTQFQGKQRENRKKQLGFVDKTVYIVGDLVFGNRYARVFVFLYVIVLHILVMCTLVFTSHRHGASRLMLIDEALRFCREHVSCRDGVISIKNF